MSIFNALIGDECALISVDTDAALPNGEHCDVSKIIMIPHLNAAIACRGSTLLLTILAPSVFIFPYDFDALAERMPDILEFVSNNAADKADELGLTRDKAGLGELLLVGYSPKCGRIVGHTFTRSDLTGGIVSSLYIKNCISPNPVGYDPGFDFSTLTADVDGLKVLAENQVRLIREHEPESSAGGDLMIAQIERKRIIVERVARY